MARAQAEGVVVGEAAQCSPHVGVIVQRLAHAHEHDVGHLRGALDGGIGRQRRVGQIAGEVEHLRHDLAGGEVARQPALRRGAEGAAHGTAGLAGDAERTPLIVEHEHGFDALAVVQLEETLDRVAVGRDDFGRQGQRRHGRHLGQPGAQGLGQVAHRLEVTGVALVDPLPELAGAKLRLAQLGQKTGKLLLVHVEQRALRLALVREGDEGLDRHLRPSGCVLSSTSSFCMTSSNALAGSLLANSASRARQSRLFTWSASTTPLTGNPAGTVTSNG